MTIKAIINVNREESAGENETKEPKREPTLMQSMNTESGAQQDWPQAFYCHETQTLMTDPVVGPNGNSYERLSVEAPGGNSDDREQGPVINETTQYYPNRALKIILEERMASSVGDYFSSIRASRKYLQQSVSHGLSHLLPKETSISMAEQEPLFRPLNDAYYGPITFNLMHQPVIDPEGNTFEQVAVENWIRINNNSPITRTPMTLDQLRPNHAIRQLMEDETNQPLETMHPAIRKWKEEPLPKATDVELGGALVEAGTDSDVQTTTVPGTQYPTTQTEWDSRLQARQRALSQFVGVCLASICLMGFVVYGSLFFLLMFVIMLFIVFSRKRAPAPL